MERRIPSLENVLASLPAIQIAVRDEVAVRIAAGQHIISEESPEISAAIERRRLQAHEHLGRSTERKSAA